MSRCCRNRAARPATLRTWSGMATTCSGTGSCATAGPLWSNCRIKSRSNGSGQVPPISELGENDIGVSGIGTIAAARAPLRGRPEDSFVVASMYATGTPWSVGAADVSAHRILSDLSAFIRHENPAKHRILRGGRSEHHLRRDRRRAVAARARTGCVGPDRGARAGVSPAATAKRTAGGDGSAGCAGRYQERPDVLQPAAALASQCRSPVGGTERPRRKDFSAPAHQAKTFQHRSNLTTARNANPWATGVLRAAAPRTGSRSLCGIGGDPGRRLTRRRSAGMEAGGPASQQ